MSRRRTSVRPTKKRKGARRRWPRLRSLVGGGLLAGAIGFVVLLVVWGARGGGGHDQFEPDVAETRSEDSGELFEAGPRLYFPVDSIDMGWVPLNTNVSYAFAVTNVGNTAAEIENVDVSILEGC